MIFSDPTDKQGNIQFCEKYTNLGYGEISDDVDRLAEFTGWTNLTMNETWFAIFEATGVWIYDDSNQSDLPQATTDLVQSQPKYALPSDSLAIKRVEVKNESNVWFKLTERSLEDIRQGVDEFRRDDGIPRFYRLVDDTIEIFPASSYSQSASMKIYFDRGMVEFESSDTTKSFGFASQLHYGVPLGASLKWLKIHLPNDGTTKRLEKDWIDFIGDKERGIQGKVGRYYNARNKDYKVALNRRTRRNEWK